MSRLGHWILKMKMHNASAELVQQLLQIKKGKDNDLPAFKIATRMAKEIGPKEILELQIRFELMDHE